ncbi:MAG: hypothetical protein NVS2B16_11940 [Chloroflexota bacterium]
MILEFGGMINVTKPQSGRRSRGLYVGHLSRDQPLVNPIRLDRVLSFESIVLTATQASLHSRFLPLRGHRGEWSSLQEGHRVRLWFGLGFVSGVAIAVVMGLRALCRQRLCTSVGLPDGSRTEEPVSNEPSDECGAATRSVVEARSRYEVVCATQGEESWAAQQAHDYLEREIVHRNEVRRCQDAGAYGRREG